MTQTMTQSGLVYIKGGDAVPVSYETGQAVFHALHFLREGDPFQRSLLGTVRRLANLGNDPLRTLGYYTPFVVEQLEELGLLMPGGNLMDPDVRRIVKLVMPVGNDTFVYQTLEDMIIRDGEAERLRD